MGVVVDEVVKFGIDLTPPAAVQGLMASPTTDTALAGSVTAGTRTHVTWLSQDYDTLSGVAYYQVLLDGTNVIPDGATTRVGSSTLLARRSLPPRSRT